MQKKGKEQGKHAQEGQSCDKMRYKQIESNSDNALQEHKNNIYTMHYVKMEKNIDKKHYKTVII